MRKISPRVFPVSVELFESRKPKNSAIISEIAGTVHFTEEKRQTVIVVTGEEGEKRYNIPYGFKIKVVEGQEIALGEPLTEGAINPHDILAVKGEKAVQDYLISEVQKTYRLQGVDTNDKHIEVIVRQMMKKVRIKDPGSTELLTGSIMERSNVYRENQKLQARIDAGPPEAVSLITYEPVLLGITKAAPGHRVVHVRRFLPGDHQGPDRRGPSRARPTPHSLGLKENVIIGKLIPAGTGMKCYNEVDVVSTKPEDAPEEAKETASSPRQRRLIIDPTAGGRTQHRPPALSFLRGPKRIVCRALSRGHGGRHKKFRIDPFLKGSREWRGQSPFPGAYFPYFRS